jgi:magnesium transporter
MKKAIAKLTKRKNRSKTNREHLQKKVGQAPGQLFFSGDKKVESVKCEAFIYNATEIDYIESNDLNQIDSLRSDDKNIWVNIEGLHDTAFIEKVGERFKLHSLLLEDVMNLNHRPKFEDYGDYIFFTIKMFNGVQNEELDYEQVSFVLGKDFVISFQEKPQDIFNTLRDRLTSGQGRMRSKGTDYLFYRLIDTIVDYYYFAIEHFAEQLEALEEEVMDNADKESLIKMQTVKKDLIFLRRSVLPVREALSGLIRSENKLFKKETRPFFQDIYDHAIHVVESIESYRDLLSSIKDLHMNALSNRMNEVMKVLTIISTIFIPLTFIAGIYGMNFQHMPELSYEYAYPIAWSVMIIITIFMIIYFKRKKWL